MKKNYAKLNATLVYNIAQRKKTEKKLRESEEKYRNLFENANDAIFIADIKTGEIIDTNKQAAKLLKRPLKEIIGIHQTKLHPPNKVRYYAEKFKRHIRLGNAADFEAEVITKDKKIIPVYISASVMVIGGKPIIQGIFRDISQFKKAEQKLKTEKKKLETYMESMVDGVGIADLKLRATFCNKSLLKMFGYKKKELIGKSVPELFVKRERAILMKRAREDIKKGISRISTYTAIDKTGKKFPVQIAVSIIKDEKGRPKEFVAVLRNITKIKKAQQKLIKQKQKYEKQIKELKRKLKQKKK